MADSAVITGYSVPTSRSWGSFKNENGDTIAAGSAPVLWVYLPDARELVGPIDVPTPLRDSVNQLDPFATVSVRYELHAGRNGKGIARRLSDLEPVGK